MPIMKPLNVQISEVTPANIQQLKSINIATLPVRYTDKFYRDLLTENSPEFMKFASWNGFCIGAVCARIENHETIEDAFKLYFMTINVLPTYRRRGIATFLLNHVMDEAMKNEKIIEVYLHVQTTNDEAKDFYISHGFEQIGIVKVCIINYIFINILLLLLLYLLFIYRIIINV
jgi:ribosomal protein S18 acetylase RimI-like enzyme